MPFGFYPSKPPKLDTPEAMIYRHSDGYPEAVLPDITPVLTEFAAYRGLDDAEYAAASLLYELKAQYIKRLHPDYRHTLKFLGFGICNGDFHADIEYYYAIYPSEIAVYRVGRASSSKPTFEPLQTVPLK